jgi:hypothetical protein
MTARATQTINSSHGTFVRRDPLTNVPAPVIASWVEAGIAAYDPEPARDGFEVPFGAVVELDGDTGEARIVAEAGSPEAEAFHAFGDPDHPVDLEVAKPTRAPAAKPTPRRKTTRKVVDGAGD